MFVRLVFVVFLASAGAPVPIDPSNLDDEDLTRYGLTYCHLVRKEPFAVRHRLATHCTAKIKFFGTDICIEDPEDDNAYVSGTCLDVYRVHEAAEKFCARTTTIPTPVTTESTDFHQPRCSKPPVAGHVAVSRLFPALGNPSGIPNE